MEGEKEEKSFSFIDKRKRSGAEEEADNKQPASESPAIKEPAAQKMGDGETSAPPIDFSTFILSLSSSAMYHMGGFQDPYSGKTSINLDLAKQTIDIIAMLEAKTKGNLTADEEKLFTHTLYELRMMFVELMNKK